MDRSYNMGINITGPIIKTEERTAWLNANNKYLNKGFLSDFLVEFIDDLGSNMLNVNAGFTGTPEEVYNGGDQTFWTPSNLTGTNFNLTYTGNAFDGAVTVLQFANITGQSITIQGTNITNTTITEGVDFNAVTDNNTTASNIVTAMDAIAGISATATNNIVRVLVDPNSDITSLTTTAAGADMTATAQALDGTATVNDDEALLAKPSGTISASNFVGLRLSIQIDSWTNPGDNKQVQIRIRNAGVDQGNSIDVSDYINTGSNDWQEFFIPIGDFGLTTESFNQVVVKTIDIGGGQAPNYRLDFMGFEESGGNKSFNTKNLLDSLVGLFGVDLNFNLRQVSIAFQGDATSATSLDDMIDPNDFGFQTRLPIGFFQRITRDGIAGETELIRDNATLVALSGNIRSRTYNGSDNGSFSIQFDFNDGLLFRTALSDNFEVIINDDLSEHDMIRITATGDLQPDI